MVSTSRIGRRRLLQLAAGVAGVGSLGLLISGCGGADTYVPPPSSGAVGTRQRSASIPSIIPFNNIDGQRTLEWCWAACAETIVRQFGIDVNNINGASVAQEYFAIKVYGAGNAVQAAAPWQVAAALTDTYRLLNGQFISLQGYSWMPIPIQFNAKAVALIQAQVPFTVLLIPYGESSGHFLTVYEITWTEDAAGNIVSIDGYRMADPAQNLYQFLPGTQPFPTQWGPAAAQVYAQAGVAWAERVG